MEWSGVEWKRTLFKIYKFQLGQFWFGCELSAIVRWRIVSGCFFLFLLIPNTKRSNKNIMQHITYTVSGWTTKSSLYNSFYRIISRNEEKITQQQLQLQHYSCQAWIPLNDKIDKATIIHILKFVYSYNTLNYLFILPIVAAFLPFFIGVFDQ